MSCPSTECSYLTEQLLIPREPGKQSSLNYVCQDFIRAAFQYLHYQTFVTSLGKCFSSYNLSIRKTFFDNFQPEYPKLRKRSVWAMFRIWRLECSKSSHSFLKVSLKSRHRFCALLNAGALESVSLNRDFFFGWGKETYILLKTDLCVMNNFFVLVYKNTSTLFFFFF